MPHQALLMVEDTQEPGKQTARVVHRFLHPSWYPQLRTLLCRGDQRYSRLPAPLPR
jgi:hypothetical protein